MDHTNMAMSSNNFEWDFLLLLQECVKCHEKGASMGCLSKGCKATYHYMCAEQAGELL